MGVNHSVVQTLGGGGTIRRGGWRRSGGDVPPDARWQITVVDACCYGRAGMKAALQSDPCVARVVAREALAEMLSMLAVCPGAATSPSGLVLRLPMRAQEALSVLLQLRELHMARYTRVVVMSNVAPDIVRRVLAHLGVNGEARVVDARCTLPVLCRTAISSIGEIDGSDEAFYCEPHNLLSHRERYVLGKTLREISIYNQARQAQLSAKTIYTHRARALLKLGAPDVLTLLRQFTPVAYRRDGLRY